MSTLDRAELLELYRLHTDEVRFQVGLNWQRTQTLLTITSGFNALGIVVLGLLDGRLRIAAALAFLAGLPAIRFAMTAQDRAHRYYQHARDARDHVGNELGLGDLGLRTTAIEAGTNVGTSLKRLMMLNALTAAGGAAVAIWLAI